MSSREVRFKQLDVFSEVPFKGNPLAVIFNADGLSEQQMREIAQWTNLSETTFILTPTDPAADYLVRIFTPDYELPFAGHPTLGTAHALIESGYTPKQSGKIVQQCGVGLIDIEERGAGVRAFAAPKARVTALNDNDLAALNEVLGTGAIDPGHSVPTVVDNGAPWLLVGVTSPERCVALAPDTERLTGMLRRIGAIGIAFYALHPAGGPATYEIRCIVVPGNKPAYEDPVTGSANAALATLFKVRQTGVGSRYTARQGTALGRDGRIFVEYDDVRDTIWIGGASATVIDGVIRLS